VKFRNVTDSDLLLPIITNIVGLLQRDYIETDIRPTKTSLDLRESKPPTRPKDVIDQVISAK
jgi:hypothetical protein